MLIHEPVKVLFAGLNFVKIRVLKDSTTKKVLKGPGKEDAHPNLFVGQIYLFQIENKTLLRVVKI